jgi:serine phosphatase RsbU (regulator of sigma subunit)
MLPFGLSGPCADAVETRLSGGDVVLFHTDGVTEARSPGGTFLGDEQLRDLVAGFLAADLRPPELLRRVVSSLRAHQPVLRDDATLLLLGWQLGPAALPPATRIG